MEKTFPSTLKTMLELWTGKSFAEKTYEECKTAFGQLLKDAEQYSPVRQPFYDLLLGKLITFLGLNSWYGNKTMELILDSPRYKNVRLLYDNFCKYLIPGVIAHNEQLCKVHKTKVATLLQINKALKSELVKYIFFCYFTDYDYVSYDISPKRISQFQHKTLGSIIFQFERGYEDPGVLTKVFLQNLIEFGGLPYVNITKVLPTAGANKQGKLYETAAIRQGSPSKTEISETPYWERHQTWQKQCQAYEEQKFNVLARLSRLKIPLTSGVITQYVAHNGDDLRKLLLESLLIVSGSITWEILNFELGWDSKFSYLTGPGYSEILMLRKTAVAISIIAETCTDWNDATHVELMSNAITAFYDLMKGLYNLE